MNTIEEITYEKSYVAFLDVLGFKNMVFSTLEGSQKKINKYFEVINSTLLELSLIQIKKPIKSIVISDSIILSVPLLGNKHDDLERLQHLCIAIAKLQQNLALNDIWLRGAITSGDTYFNADRHQVVGPAYINAYLLEEKSAIYPRVILDSKIIKEFSYPSATDFIHEINKFGEGGLEYSNWGKNILYYWSHSDGKPVTNINKDVPLFIDYFSYIVENNDNNLIKVISHLEKNLYQSVSIYSKYRWVTDYLVSLIEKQEIDGNIANSEAKYRLTNL